MTVSKMKHENKIVVDFSDDKINRCKVSKKLRETEILILSDDRYIDNNVKVGAYNILLLLKEKHNVKRLRKYGPFGIRIFQEKSGEVKEIKMDRDINFRENDWAKRNELHIYNLIDAILYCKKMDELSIFN